MESWGPASAGPIRARQIRDHGRHERHAFTPLPARLACRRPSPAEAGLYNGLSRCPHRQIVGSGLALIRQKASFRIVGSGFSRTDPGATDPRSRSSRKACVRTTSSETPCRRPSPAEAGLYNGLSRCPHRQIVGSGLGACAASCENAVLVAAQRRRARWGGRRGEAPGIPADERVRSSASSRESVELVDEHRGRGIVPPTRRAGRWRVS
jgi:hypothetical protein